MDATVLEENYRRTPTVLGHKTMDLLRAATVSAAPVAVVALRLMATLAAEAAATGAPHTGPEEELVEEAIADAAATQTATSLASHASATMPAAELKKYDATSPPRQATMTASPPSPLDFAIYSSQRNSNLWGSPSTTRRKTQSIENAGGNNDTKCLYFPFFLDQAPLTWLESLDKYSIDEWNQLKDQFASNFAGIMGCSGTHMDLAMVKQEQGETLRSTCGASSTRLPP
jgi:hypothetical protein